MSARWRRTAAAVLAVAGLLLVDARPAAALPPPAPVTDLAASLGLRGLNLTWTNVASGTPVVRDVTGLTPTYAPTDGRGVPATSTGAYDTGFANTASRTYAVWARETDGTVSNVAAELTVAPLPPLATATVLDAPASVVLSGKSVTLAGRITRAGLPFPGAKVAVRSRVAGTTTETTVAWVTSAVDGSLRTSYVPSRNRYYRLSFPGDAYSSASSSGSRFVQIQPRLTLALSPGTIPWKSASTLSGGVSPYLAGKTVSVQRWYGDSWHDVATRTLTDNSRWAWSTAPAMGRHAYRVRLAGTTTYRSAVSPVAWLTVTPRTLSQGLSGPDVLALEKRLNVLKYYVGKVDGYFDSDLRHAVYAFQKVERLSRTGKWTATERTRVKAPRGVGIRFPSSTTRLVVEVDLTRQVMVLHRQGVIQRIVDVSTGNDDYYYVDGVRYKAYTPRGTFSIYRKIDGVRVSRLGELYRPSYFHQGWAIHGSGSVPTYPASHGCVRITNHVADLLFSTLEIGSRVAVYD
jgi:peptidoglycan hydrolase-like protein with peptidoglycan-binding domain